MVVTIFVRYTVWHYLEAPRLLSQLWSNLLWYLWHIFSVGQLARSLFAPWRRVIASRTRRFDLEDMASAFIANLMSRFIGAFMRLVLITIGLFTEFLAVVLGLLFYVIWFFLPLIIAFTFSYGLTLIF